MKNLPNTSLLGQQGVNLIERRFAELGQVWRPTSIHDTGIDGTLELRDTDTGEVSNLHLQIQSKALSGAFESETKNSFAFRISEDDLDYWLKGNIPVLLIVTRPTNEEVYWVSIKEYFREEKARKSRKITFDKKANLLDKKSLPRLWSLASTKQIGIYQAPIPVAEELISNLLRVSVLPSRLFLGTAKHGSAKEFVEALRSQGSVCREWVLRSGQLLTVHDLREPPLSDLCDQGTVEEFDSSMWSESDDPQTLRDFVQLLNGCLRARVELERVWYQSRRPFRLFYFAAPEDYSTRVYAYMSAHQNTSREVFRAYYKRKDGSLNYYRHSALKAQFHRFGGAWYLEMTPTYYFTYLEGRSDRYYEERLSGIKRLERNNAVLGQLLMWVAVLSNREDLFKKQYSFLQFGNLERFTAPVMIDDDVWRPHDEFDNVGTDVSDINPGSETGGAENENQLPL